MSFPPLSIGRIHFQFKMSLSSNLQLHYNSKSAYGNVTLQNLVSRIRFGSALFANVP